MAFDPTQIEEDHLGDGHLDETPIHRVLMAVQAEQITGRLTIPTENGENHMFFMRGQPVGVSLAEILHPLGQLLLELGHINGAQFVRAQRLVAEAGRLPGQVYKELKAIDEDTLKSVFHLQARRKLEYFCRFRDRPFSFGRGLTFLSGFHSAPLHMDSVVFVALRAYLSDDELEDWLRAHARKAIHIAQGAESALPAPLETYGFGAAEQRFLARLAAGFEAIEHLAETGTLPRLEMAILLRYLELLGRLQFRDTDSAPLLDALGESTDEDVFTSSRSQREQEVSAQKQTDERRRNGMDAADAPAPAAFPPNQAKSTSPAVLADPSEARGGSAADAAEATPTIHAVSAKPAPIHPASPRPPSVPGNDENCASPARVKRKGRREVPEPSQGSSATSTPRPERASSSALPSILLSAELQADVLDA